MEERKLGAIVGRKLEDLPSLLAHIQLDRISNLSIMQSLALIEIRTLFSILSM